jgi:hypothetical protein
MKYAKNVSGWASVPLAYVTAPAAPVVGSRRSADWTSMLKPSGQVTLTDPPGVEGVAYAQAAKLTRLAPIRVSRVGAPPGSVMSNVRVNARVAPAVSRSPKSIRRSV